MIILCLVFLAFISLNIVLNSIKTKKINDYMKEMETELCEEFKIIK